MTGVPPEMQDDLDRIMRVMECAFLPHYGEAWNRRQVSDSLVLTSSRYCLITPDGLFRPADGEVTAGFTLSRGLFDEEELLLFAIAPAYRGQGLGRKLLCHCIEQARARGVRRMFLEMRKDNPAGALYASLGFRIVGVRPQYYRLSGGERLDAISQELVLV
ncbi:GNAT family N-acetyltransferase [Novosphingobium sp. Chol11]|uniref:GNAT family N-acetyltransferase n=1 Tax=Novosphingobium sp. Chol11 TaxID=1385763 RepID=UPI0025E6D42E|nr:GNAT family N-acetyltransferase [Novosphingobium sp. Chol11]